MLEHPKEYYNKILVDDSSFQGDQKKNIFDLYEKDEQGEHALDFVSVSKEADNVEKKLSKPMNFDKKDGSV